MDSWTTVSVENGRLFCRDLEGQERTDIKQAFQEML